MGRIHIYTYVDGTLLRHIYVHTTTCPMLLPQLVRRRRLHLRLLQLSLKYGPSGGPLPPHSPTHGLSQLGKRHRTGCPTKGCNQPPPPPPGGPAAFQPSTTSTTRAPGDQPVENARDLPARPPLMGGVGTGSLSPVCACPTISPNSRRNLLPSERGSRKL